MEPGPAATRYFEDVAVGSAIPPVTHRPDEVQLFAFSAATWDTHRTHWDAPFATQVDKLPGVLVHGHLQAAMLASMVTHWAGKRAWLRRINYQNRGMAIPGDTLTCCGKVTSKKQENGQGTVTCDVWIENQKGEKPTVGEVTIQLPLRGEGPRSP